MRIHAKIENQIKITDLYTAFSAQRSADYSFRGESHDFWELLMVNRGKIGSVINNEIHYFSTGQCVFYEPMEFHSAWVEGGEEAVITVFTFSAENMPKLKFRRFEITEYEFGLANTVLSEISSAFNVAGVSVLGVNEERELDAICAVKKLELLLLGILGKESRGDACVKPKRAKVFERIINVLEENIRCDLSADEIARICNVSLSYLQKIFMKYVGCGVISYFNQMKITYATIMLLDGMSVAEVSENLGFSNPNYFSTVFKRIKGVSPTEYKKNGYILNL